MRITRAASDDSFEINVIPLIDVMLTLLMFFVLTTTFEKHSRLKVALPEASPAQELKQQEGLTIVVDADGKFFVGANEVVDNNVDALREAIEVAAANNFEQPVTLRADAKTPHQFVVTAMDALGQLGFAKLSIATMQSKEGNGKNSQNASRAATK